MNFTPIAIRAPVLVLAGALCVGLQTETMGDVLDGPVAAAGSGGDSQIAQIPKGPAATSPVVQAADDSLAAESFDLVDGIGDGSGITFANGRFYIVDSHDNKVYAYWAGGQRDASADFDLDADNTDAAGITYANGRFYVVNDGFVSGDKVYAYTGAGERDAEADFDLHENNEFPSGIAWADSRFHVVDKVSDTVYAYSDAGQRDSAAEFELYESNTLPEGIVWANGRLYVVDALYFPDSSFRFGYKVFAYSGAGVRDSAAEFFLHDDNGDPGGIAWGNDRFHVVDRSHGTIFAYTVRGRHDASAGIELPEDNGDPSGVAWANGRFYVVNGGLTGDTKVFEYTAAGERDGAADFKLHEDNGFPTGITWAGDRFYVADSFELKVYAYTAAGQHDTSAGFSLHEDNGFPAGIAWNDGKFYVVDSDNDRVYAYTAAGRRDTDAEFDLQQRNRGPSGIEWVEGRFYIPDSWNKKVYAYDAAGEHDAAADFDLHSENGSPAGIVWADGRFHAVDSTGDKVYSYSGSSAQDDDDAAETTYGVNEALPGVPTSGAFDPAALSGGSHSSSVTGTTIRLDEGGYFELSDGTRYTCMSSGGCTIENGVVSGGTVVRRAADSGGGEVDRFPSLRTAVSPGDQTYTVGTAIDPLTLPEASGGNGTLIYSLFPEVPGLTFDAATRRLSGSPSTAGTYAMSYTVTDEDGDTDTITFDVTVEPDGGDSAVKLFGLLNGNGNPAGIAYANGRYYVVDGDDAKVYAYMESGQRDAASDFDLVHDGDFSPRGITYANDRFYIVGGGFEDHGDQLLDDKVYAYTGAGDPDPEAGFDLRADNRYPRGIAYANGRFYVVDSHDNKLYAYTGAGRQDAAADFDLHPDTSYPDGVALAEGRLYVLGGDDKVWVYTVAGMHEEAAGFILHNDNDWPVGIAYATADSIFPIGKTERCLCTPSLVSAMRRWSSTCPRTTDTPRESR